MHPKQKQIIEVSIDLFAKKGFHATSVQEIVDQANVAKGSFYNYFQSKEDLVISMYDYYYALLMKKMYEVKNKDNPKQSLEAQLNIYFKFLQDNKSLIIMMMRDQVPLGKDVEILMVRSKQQTFEWAKDMIRTIYGDAIVPYEYDATVLFEGMIKSYSNWLVVDENCIDVDYLPKFIVNMLDIICMNLINGGHQPTIKHLPHILHADVLLLNKLRQMVQSVVTVEQEKALEAIDVLEKELQKESKQMIVLESMLLHLRKYDALKEEVKQLEEMLNIRE
ncbi:TetR/AcrR family transcriptional regulator [Bacillaceae bacterium W0354]